MENEKIKEHKDIISIQERFDEVKNDPEFQKSITDHPSNIAKTSNNGKSKS